MESIERDKVAQYRKYTQTLLSRYANDDVSDDAVEVQLIFDTERDHYQWMNNEKTLYWAYNLLTNGSTQSTVWLEDAVAAWSNTALGPSPNQC